VERDPALAITDIPGAGPINHPDRPKLADVLGPGLITGASDDDPSGIATYAQAGAAFGFALSWTLLLTYPLMCAIQMISAEIGRVTGKGIAANMRRYYPRPLLYALVGLLVLANVINIGADLGAMGAALQLILPGPQWLYVAAFAILTVLLEVFMRYARYVSVLRWLTLSLLAYVATVFVVGVPWGTVAYHLVVPHVEWTAAYFTMVVAIFGTTISPYLFFWQASQEAEDERDDPAAETLLKTPSQAPRELGRIRLDTMVGMGASNIVALFIVLTTAATLHAHGVTNVETSADAAKALKPIAGLRGLRARHRRHWTACGAGFGRQRRLCAWRDARLAHRPCGARAPGARLLSGDCGRDARGGAAQFLPARSDQGADLQRHRQRRRRGSHHGPDHAHGFAARGHGGLPPQAVAKNPRLAGDRVHDRRGGRHVRDLERLSRAGAIPRARAK
jgi:Mn2+/Fe2+ NRAMP family transporter